MRRMFFTGLLFLLSGAAQGQGSDTQSVVEIPADGGSGGADSAIWKAECPQGMMMTGMRVMVGGTCHNQCNADGRPLATFNIICSGVSGGAQPPAK